MLLLLFELLEARVLALNKALEMRESLAELLENVGCAVAVTRRVILRIDRVDDHKHLLTLRWLLVERPRTTSKRTVVTKLHFIHLLQPNNFVIP